MGGPHAPIEDDEYRGYHIPKGATIVENQWAINLDDESFQDPNEFRPERWLQHPDQLLSLFGLGRRSCPAKHIAQNSLFIAIARILWTYNISHCYVNGKKVPIDSLDTLQLIVASPSHLEATFSIRSPAHQRIVEREWESTTTDVNVTMDHILHSFKQIVFFLMPFMISCTTQLKLELILFTQSHTEIAVQLEDSTGPYT
jgi:cytochrome P450